MFKQGDRVRVKNDEALGATAGMLGEVVTTADDERGHMVIVAIPDYPHPLLGKSRQALAYAEDEIELEPEVILVEPGTPVEYRGRRSYEKRTIRINRIFEVRLGDEVVGLVIYKLVTRESGRQRSGVVLSRWQSPAWTFRRGSQRWGRTTEAYSKRDAIQRLIDGHKRQENDHA